MYVNVKYIVEDRASSIAPLIYPWMIIKENTINNILLLVFGIKVAITGITLIIAQFPIVKQFT